MSNIIFDKNNVIFDERSRLSGEVFCPSSKSVAHRELIAAALSDMPSLLLCRGISKDVEATISCLRSLGADITVDRELIKISPIKEPARSPILNCRESGTTLRFMIPLAAFLGADATFECAPSLARRPISVLCEELERHGVCFPDGYSFPLRMSGRAVGSEWRIRGDVSSQFISGLLLAFPLARQNMSLEIIGRCESLPYVDITRSVMKKRGIDVLFKDGIYSLAKCSYLSPISEGVPAAVEADWSGAAFWLASGLSSEEGITVRGLSLSSPQGDKAILDLLRSAGADISATEDGVTVKKSTLRAFECNCADTPDMVPVLSICAAIAKGESRIHGTERLRLKESDRIESTLGMLSSLGISASYSDGTLTIEGGRIRGGHVEGCNDHRIVMSAAVASCFTDGRIEISDAGAVSKSYPDFFSHFASLQAKEQR